MPKVSVLMTNYNGDKYISEAIESILQQTFTDFELIVMDDGSNDTSWKIIQKYAHQDKRIRYYQNQQNLGISHTRNRLIDLAQGELIAWLDSDDIMDRKRLEKQVNFLKTHQNIGIVGSWLRIVDRKGHQTSTRKYPTKNEDIKQTFFFRSPLPQPSMMIRRKCLEKTGYYDVSLNSGEDLDLIIRVAQYFELSNIPEFLTMYRIHGNNISLRGQKKMIQNTLLIRRRMLKRGHKMGMMAKIAYGMTWGAQYIPPKILFYIFNSFIKLLPSKK